jgi:hypothetical protein
MRILETSGFFAHIRCAEYHLEEDQAVGSLQALCKFVRIGSGKLRNYFLHSFDVFQYLVNHFFRFI